jgi:hypothetical protein
MPTTLEQLRRAVGSEKLLVLAASIDNLIEERSARAEGLPIDEEIETLDVKRLAQEYDVGFETFRKQICRVVGEGAVFKLGSKWVIRKRKFLEFLKVKESETNAD